MSKSNHSTPGTGRLPGEHSLRTMIVDDHELLRHGLRDIINAIKGFTVIAEANSCRDALTRIQRTKVDLVFVDLSLPDGNGSELVHLLRQHNAPPAIIVLSATLNDELLLETMLAGASGYLTKDVLAADIAQLLPGLHRGEMIMTSSVASRLINLLIQKCLTFEMNQIASNSDTNVSTPTNQISYEIHTIVPPLKREESLLSHLTPQEDKIFQLMRLGLSNKQIASQLAISRFTVGKHIQNILKKLGVTNRTQAAQAASYTTFEGVKKLIDTSKFRN
ncbi:MAG TPA: response regulator transcription factor [Ktedonobacteraceae bacterium]|nr:response regulator transcription factor [Ktedonobacteraceae bacterium]